MGRRKGVGGENAPATLEEQIADSLRRAEESGELKSARDYGKPLDFGDGYNETPAELRMAFKVLKDAGYAPPEVAMLQELAALRRQLEAADPQGEETERLRRKAAELEITVSLRIERLGRVS